MSNEELECKIEFIVDTLARLAVNDEKHELRLSRLERIVKLMIRAGRPERRLRREQNARFDEQFAKVNAALAGVNLTLAGVNLTLAGVNLTLAGVNDTLAGVNDTLAELAQSQKRTDHKLETLVDIVRRQHNGNA